MKTILVDDETHNWLFIRRVEEQRPVWKIAKDAIMEYKESRG